ncbi:MAG: EVE domain-containing protein [Deltaproteobacteria bacterium]|nr:EVE domain-containing protein [Deltaproteobacteria bacterium]
MAADPARPWFWLLKSEPDDYSIDDLKRDRRAPWDGVRNFSARNRLREMKRNELALFYHSSTRPTGVVGLCRIAKTAHPDPSQFDSCSRYHDPKSTEDEPRWSMVEVQYVSHLPRIVTLDEIKAEPALSEMVLVRRARLSVQPVTVAQFEHIVAMSGGRMPGRNS